MPEATTFHYVGYPTGDLSSGHMLFDVQMVGPGINLNNDDSLWIDDGRNLRSGRSRRRHRTRCRNTISPFSQRKSRWSGQSGIRSSGGFIRSINSASVGNLCRARRSDCRIDASRHASAWTSGRRTDSFGLSHMSGQTARFWWTHTWAELPSMLRMTRPYMWKGETDWSSLSERAIPFRTFQPRREDG